jgi:serine/threonine-protein kinase
LLTGRYVREGRTPNEAMLSAMIVPAPPLSSVIPGVAEAVARVIDGALAFEKSKRWPDAQRMQEAVRQAYTERTGRRISMAPRPVVPDAAANPILGLSRDMAPPGPTAQAVARATFGGPRSRTRRIAVAFGATAGVVVGLGVALVRPVLSSPASGTAVAAQSQPQPRSVDPATPAQPAPPAGSAVVDGPSLSAVAPAPAATTGARSASASASAPGSAAAPRPASKANCATPYVVDPVTHIKHWKIDCL